MFGFLSIIVVCITILCIVKMLQQSPITFVVHKKIEEIRPEPKELSEEEKKALEDQSKITDGMNEIIRFTQDFLGGDIDAESEPKAE